MTDPRPTPEQFLAQVQNATPGWSDQYGGPQGVTALCAALQAELARQSEAIAQVRIAAIKEMRKTRSGLEVARMLNVSKSAVSKAAHARSWEDPTW